MAKLFGALNINDTERVFNTTEGQMLMWNASQQALARYNADTQNILSMFVEGTTTEFKWRYKLPGYGTLQEEGQYAKSAAVKSGGSWDVAFPIRQYGEQMAFDDETRAYMTLAEYENHMLTVMNDDLGTLRKLVFDAIFTNTSTTFTDKIHGSLTIQPLANQDGTLYPATIGSTSEAEANNYLYSGYAASAISDTNNPIVTLVNQLEGFYGAPTGGSNIWIFVNNAQTAKIQALADFVPVTLRNINPSDLTTTLSNLPPIPPNMRLLGSCDGAWIYEWRRLPANYMVAIHGDQPKPLMQRQDPADTGLPAGLNLISRESTYPFHAAFFRRRIGFGVANRLSAAVMYLTSGSSYTAPTFAL